MMYPYLYRIQYSYPYPCNELSQVLSGLHHQIGISFLLEDRSDRLQFLGISFNPK